jgi:hypothetical protein
MNRREFLLSSAIAGTLAGTAAFGEQTKTAEDTQPAQQDPGVDRRKLVTYCGLYCGLCDWHVRLPQRAKALRESLALAECPPPRSVAQFLHSLASQPTEHKRCRGGTCGAKCAIKKCAMAKGVTVCAECGDFPCKHIQTLARSESTLIHDGERLRKIGMDAWIDEQEQRKARGFCYADVRCLPCTVPEE